MKKSIYRFPSLLLAMALALGMLAAFPKTARAATAADLKDFINSFDPNNSGATTGRLTAVNNLNNTVTVTGTVTSATNTLALQIDPDVTVLWQADYSGTITDLITITGGGRFQLASSGKFQPLATP